MEKIAYLPTVGKYNYMLVTVDAEDLLKLKKHKWYISKRSETYYRVCTVSRKSQSLARLLLGAKKGDIVDHINRNPLDNRKCNLRFCSIQQNNHNSGNNRRNTSGVKGVHRQNDKWEVSIWLNNKKIYLGRYTSLEEAIKVRRDAEAKYWPKAG